MYAMVMLGITMLICYAMLWYVMLCMLCYAMLCKQTIISAAIFAQGTLLNLINAALQLN